MAKKKRKKAAPAPKPRSFTGVIKGRTRPVQTLARAIRDIVYEELPDAEETYYAGQKPMAMYRTTADVCWIQPLTNRCNVYFTRGLDLTDDEGLLEGSSERLRHVKIRSLDELERIPLRQWIQESVALNDELAGAGLTFDEVREKLKGICLALPKTKETITWGKPHFRVHDKIFCGCGEVRGKPSIGLKAEPHESTLLMKAPGIEKASYSRPGDGWIAIDPNTFDDWSEIQRLVVDSYRLVAPKRTAALLD